VIEQRVIEVEQHPLDVIRHAVQPNPRKCPERIVLDHVENAGARSRDR